MLGKELFQHIFGLTSLWTVSGVKLDIPAEEIHVTVSTPLVQSSAVLSGRKTLLATIRQRSVDGGIWTRANSEHASYPMISLIGLAGGRFV